MKVYKKAHPLNTIRRKSVIERLEAQLEKGTKPLKKSLKPFHDEPIPLTEGDKVRINKEITTLKARI